MLRYTVLRVLIFFGCLGLIWLVGLRDQPLLLGVSAALVSMVISYFALRRFREDYSRQIAQRLEDRAAKRGPGVDEQAEDAQTGTTPENGEETYR